MGRGVTSVHTACMQTANIPIAHAPRRVSVFIVEDSLPITERLVDLLGGIEGATIVGHAASADEAIRGIDATRPDAVVLDIKLHKSSGMDVLRALNERSPWIDVFVLTNDATPQHRRRCTQLGARGFFDKSTEFAKVRAAIEGREYQTVH